MTRTNTAAVTITTRSAIYRSLALLLCLLIACSSLHAQVAPNMGTPFFKISDSAYIDSFQRTLISVHKIGFRPNQLLRHYLRVDSTPCVTSVMWPYVNLLHNNLRIKISMRDSSQLSDNVNPLLHQNYKINAYHPGDKLLTGGVVRHWDSVSMFMAEDLTPVVYYDIDITDLMQSWITAGYFAIDTPVVFTIQNNNALVPALAMLPPTYLLNDTLLDVSAQIDYEFEINKNITQCLSTTGVDLNNPVRFRWKDCCPSPNYQLQLLRLYNIDSSIANDPTTIKAVIDWSQALSIETNNRDTNIALTLAEGSGYYAWRVRRIYDIYPNGIGDDRNWGDWTTYTPLIDGDTVGINTASINSYIFYYSQFDSNLNFIYHRQFVEGEIDHGSKIRIGEKTTYADFLMMPIQEQVKSQTADTIIASVTVPDHNGRPSFQTLPAPVAANGFGFVYGLLTNKYGSLYTMEDYDADSTALNPNTVDSGNFIGGYYSDNNTGDTLVPSALGFPFSRTLYGNDNLNRPYMITTPGAFHTFTSNHQVQKYYGKSTDMELIRLFGDEAPKSESVLKSCTIDPNGVVNVAYTDEAGRTLATCLAGPPAGEQDTFEYQPFTTFDTITSKLHIGNAWTERATYVITTPTSMTYLYQVTPKVFSDICDSLCSTCDYMVRLVAKNRTDTSLHYTDSIVINPSIDTTGAMSCSGSLFQINSNYSPGGNVTLSPGTWDIQVCITPNNIDPVTGLSYIDEVVGRVRAKIDSNVEHEEWAVDNGYAHATIDSMRSYLNVNNIQGLLTYLQADTTQPFVTIRSGCDTMSIPTDHCSKRDCSAFPTFAEYMVDYLHQWDTAHGTSFFTSVTDLSQTTSAAQNQDTVFSNAQFDTLIRNMLVEGYDCDTMWEAWEMTVESFAQTEVAAAAPAAAIGANMPIVDWWNDFMNRVGYKYPLVKCDTAELYNAAYTPANLRDSAYRYFPYNFGNRPNLEDAFYLSYAQLYGKPMLLPFASYGWYDTLKNFPTYSDTSQYHVWAFWQAVKGANNYYAALANNLPININTNPNNPAQGYAQMEEVCLNACDQRINELVQDIVDNCNEQLLAVQTYTYPMYNSPATDTVALDKVYCIANSIIAQCRQGCFLTPDTNGAITGPQLTAYQHSLSYNIDVVAHPETLTPTCDTGYSPVYPDTTYISTTGLMQWLDWRGMQLHDSLDQTGYGPGWPWNPFHSNNAGALGLSSYNCDTNATVYLHGSDISEWFTLSQTQEFASTCTNIYCKQVYPDTVMKGTIFDVNIAVAPETSAMVAGDSLVILAPVDLTHDSLYFTEGTYVGGVHKYVFYGARPVGDTIHFKYQLRATSNGLIAYPTVTVHRYHGVTDYPCILTDMSTIVNSCLTLYFDRIDSNNNLIKTPICSGAQSVCGNTGNCGSACIKWIDPTYFPDTLAADTLTPITCEMAACDNFLTSLTYQINSIVDAHEATIRAEYQDKCINDTSIHDLFVNSFSISQYMYTLYYYDRAGNLARTVQPQGVRETGTSRFTTPTHKYVSGYEFNTLGQTRAQKTPDADSTSFLYDMRGKVRISQNAKQKYDSHADTTIWSYTKYDALSRVIETGEMYLYIPFNTDSLDEEDFPTEDAYKHLHYITKTVYGDTCPKVLPGYNKKYIGDNILNRISYTVTDRDGLWTTPGDQVWSIYSYDMHGNVKDLIQYVSPATKSVHIGYEYDLISNKVTGTWMTKLDSAGKTHVGEDYFAQWYSYDGDKRLTRVQSNYRYDSFRSDTWEPEAAYSYYLHGPLKRTVLGNNVQGIDYRYTVEGWLKAINGHPGRFEPTADTTSWPDTTLPWWVYPSTPRDLYTEVLGYYKGDYVRHNSVLDVDSIMLYGNNLYNGNISSKMEASPDVQYPIPSPSFQNLDWGYTYHYDQLNRLKYTHTNIFHTRADTTFDGWLPATPHGCTPDTAQHGVWDEYFTYDKNGNLLKLGRNAMDTCTGGRLSWIKLDSLDYYYETVAGGDTVNKLQAIHDHAGFLNKGDLGLTFYTNDKIGQRIWDEGDSARTLLHIWWTPYGKVDRVDRFNIEVIHIPENSAHTIDAHDSLAFNTGQSSWYLYDAAGNRVREYSFPISGTILDTNHVYPLDIYSDAVFYPDTVYAPYDSTKHVLATKYNIYEASGNILGTYTRRPWTWDAEQFYYYWWYPNVDTAYAADSMGITDRYLYGSEQLASIKGTNHLTVGDSMRAHGWGLPNRLRPVAIRMGMRYYELHDHLGNLKVSVQDPFYDPSHSLSRYNYYAFGSLQPLNWGEQFGYTKGYNNKLRDDSWQNEGDMLNYGMREYDTRIGRFISVDPLTRQYPWNSTYSYAENDVIRCRDLDGSERLDVNETRSPILGKPGGAVINVKLCYTIVNQGVGALGEFINNKEFKNYFSASHQTLYMMTLPTSTSPATFLTEEEERWARKADRGKQKFADRLAAKGITYYKVDVNYDYDIAGVSNVSDAYNWMMKDVSGRGIIMGTTTDEASLSKIDAHLTQLNHTAKAEFKDPNTGGFGSNTQAHGFDLNIIFLNKNTTMTQDATGRAVHETGHNSIGLDVHDKGSKYQYNVEGISSNKSENLYYNDWNTKDLINDQTNRATIGTEGSECTPPTSSH